jgi:hypothetical protein
MSLIGDDVLEVEPGRRLCAAEATMISRHYPNGVLLSSREGACSHVAERQGYAGVRVAVSQLEAAVQQPLATYRAGRGLRSRGPRL